jgi:ribosomal protein S30
VTNAPTIANQLAALDEATTDDLIAQYARLHNKAPRTRNRAWLIKRVAWALQAEAFGGLSKAATKRLDELIAQIGGSLTDAGRTVTTTLPRKPKPNAPAVGTTLTRTRRGQQIVVHCRDNGYEYEGVLYRSLSAVATAATGSHWNGWLFFGLVSRRKSS